MARLQGTVAVVTGAAHGMGASHALSLAREGADVAVVDIAHGLPGISYPLGTEAEQIAVVRQIEALGRRAITVACDVSKAEQVRAMVTQVMDAFGRIDILVNNAGVTPAGTVLWETSEDKMALIINVNLMGPFYTCKYVVPHMISRRSGKIINIGSIWGREGGVGGTIYASSKAGVHQLTFTLAKELAPYNINVNCVAPATVSTFMMKDPDARRAVGLATGAKDNTEEEVYQAMCKKVHMMGREITAQDVSNAVVFLASEESRNITGSVIYVDGGHL